MNSKADATSAASSAKRAAGLLGATGGAGVGKGICGCSRRVRTGQGFGGPMIAVGSRGLASSARSRLRFAHTSTVSFPRVTFTRS